MPCPGWYKKLFTLMAGSGFSWVPFMSPRTFLSVLILVNDFMITEC